MLTVTLDRLDTKFSEVHTNEDNPDFDTLNIVIKIDSPEIDELLSNPEISRQLVAEIAEILRKHPTINFLRMTHLSLLPPDVFQYLFEVVENNGLVKFSAYSEEEEWSEDDEWELVDGGDCPDYHMRFPIPGMYGYRGGDDEFSDHLVSRATIEYAKKTEDDLIQFFTLSRAILLAVVAAEDTTQSVNKVPLDVLLHMLGFFLYGSFGQIVDDAPDTVLRLSSRIQAMPISRLLPSISPAERRALEARHKVDDDRAAKSPKRK